MIWYNEKEHALLRIPIQNEEDYLSFLHQLLYETLTASKENLYSLYSHTYPCDTYFTAFLLNTDLQIYQNQQLLLDCSGNTLTASKENLYSLYSHTYPCDTYFTAFLLNTDLQIYQNQQLLLDCSGNTSEALKNNTLIL